HDQATIASKLLDFGAAVNVTLGLPVLRTSVDHGTGYDIAGRGVADAGGIRAAVETAFAIARRRAAAATASAPAPAPGPSARTGPNRRTVRLSCRCVVPSGKPCTVVMRRFGLAHATLALTLLTPAVASAVRPTPHQLIEQALGPVRALLGQLNATAAERRDVA